MSAPEEQVEGASQPDQKGEAWSISFATKKTRKTTKKEKAAMAKSAGQGAETNRSDSDCEGGTTPEAAVDVSGMIDLAVAVPRNLQTTRDDIAARNHFDLLRFYCMVRQYKATCGISSLTSVWNHLYSHVGAGSLPPVSQEEIMSILGFHPPFGDIRWGPFTGNTTLMRWFHAINKHFGVTGKAFYLWKAHGFGRTIGVTREDARDKLKTTLRDPCAGVIYHCKNHYMVPIGYQEQPIAQVDCYAKELPESASTTQIIIGEVSRGKHTSLHVKKWTDIATDIECQAPYFFNIRQAEKGVQKREKWRKVGGNLHCLMCFRSDIAEEDIAQFEEADEEVEEEDEVDASNPETPVDA